VVVIANGAAGAWALAASQREGFRRRALWWFTAAAQVAMFVQVALGVAHMNADDIDPPRLHDFYGFIALITIAILYAYRLQLRDRLHVLYGFGGLFLMGLGIRAMVLHG
jgi:hypothetical protein